MTTPLIIDEAETKPNNHKTNLSSSLILSSLFVRFEKAADYGCP